jgi:predicted dehydrogenase
MASLSDEGKRKYSVALVGAAEGHWSSIAHMPAIQHSGRFELGALVTSNLASASAARERWRTRATADYDTILSDSNIDVVTITVRVTEHIDLALAALAAGKNVYCEWPLAPTYSDAQRLQRAAHQHPERLLVAGLQGRFSPAIRSARRHISDGRIGQPLGASVRVFVPLGLQARPAHRAHLRHRRTGANVLTIQAAHAIDMLNQLLGDPQVLHSRLWSAVPEFRIAETGEVVPRDAPDNVLVELDYAGIVASIHASQTSARPTADIEIFGSRGNLRLSATGQPESSAMNLDIYGATPDIVERYSPEQLAAGSVNGLPVTSPAFNLCLAYGAMAESLDQTDFDRQRVERPAGIESATQLQALVTEIEDRATSGADING